MNQQTTNKWQHSPLESQVTKEPVKEVRNLLPDSSISWNDLLGLPWMSFEEEIK